MKKSLMKMSSMFMLASAMVVVMPSCKSKQNVATGVSKGMTEVTVPLSGIEYQSNKDYFRAKSMAKSPDMAFAQTTALQNVNLQMSTLICAKIQSVIHKYTNQRSIADAQDFENKTQELSKQEVNKQLSEARIIGEKIYKDEKGTIEYWMAIEISKEAIINGVSRQISENKKLQIDFDQKKFEEATKAEFEKMP